MKRIIVLALAACMVLGAAFSASATEFNASGYIYAGYDYYQADDNGKTNNFSQRFRSQINIIASENVSGVVYFEIDQTWGVGGGDLGADGINVETKRAYIDFMVPSTAVKVRAGIQGVSLPAAVAGNPVLSDDVAAIFATTPVGGADVSLFFARPADAGSDQTTADLFGAVVSADLGAVNVSPYFMYANIGDKAVISGSSDAIGNFDDNAYWVGVAVDAAPMTNLALDFDAVYGKINGQDAGFFLAGKAAYATDFAVPAILAWYGSGNDNDNEGIMPSLGSASFAPTTLVGWGAAATSSDNELGSGLGKWGVSLQASDITFIEKVSHTARITYVRGTNENASGIKTWSDDDSAVEFDFVTIYAAYDNLDVIVDLAYAVTDLDDAAPSTDEVFKAALGVKYNF